MRRGIGGSKWGASEVQSNLSFQGEVVTVKVSAASLSPLSSSPPPWNQKLDCRGRSKTVELWYTEIFVFWIFSFVPRGWPLVVY